MVWLGYRHFDNIHTGVAAATLWLLAFYTSQMTSQVDHAVPAMLLVWAVAAYRLPLLSGMLIGCAGGLIYYPLFLLPLWGGFYWRRGALRFFAAAAFVLGLLVLALALTRSPVRPISGTNRGGCSAGGTPWPSCRPVFGDSTRMSSGSR